MKNQWKDAVIELTYKRTLGMGPLQPSNLRQVPKNKLYDHQLKGLVVTHQQYTSKGIEYFSLIGKWFEPRGISYWFVVIVRVKVVFRKTVVSDWRFDYLSGSHLQSQVKSRRQMMVFMPVVLVLIGQFCRLSLSGNRVYKLRIT